jgi:Ca2+-binding EF-hand superfamily protein|tara:strand:- start:587 stop:751 length:165 start_codon:yes stop_codon:yes gene_type:complete
VSPNPELKPNPHPSQVYRLFDMYDKDGDGTIDYSELTLLLEDEKPSWLQSAGAQ